ncbi:MAG: hypothetical protein H7Z41_20185 [Cytophagales bacterium]|nr:hypothetical protein [Armatimonadota bacterium]
MSGIEMGALVLRQGDLPALSLLGGLWRASLGGVLFALLVWGVCRSLPRLPAATRFWLWWLVSAKLLLGLFYTAAALPLVLRLPASHPVTAPAFFVARLAAHPTRLLTTRSAARPPVGSFAVPAAAVPSIAAPRFPTDPSPSVLPNADGSRSRAAGESGVGIAAGAARSQGPSGATRTAMWIVAFCWTAGFLLRVARMAHASHAARLLLRGATPASETVRGEADRIARRLTGRRRPAPRIVVSDQIPSPFIVGLLRPVIVLPTSTLSLPEIRMALAHELAHLGRGDLWLSLVPSLAEAIFFFLPVARWSARECALCREEACDSAAVAYLGTDWLAAYGQLLLKVTLASQRRGQTVPTIGMAITTSPAFAQMRRRLQAIKNAATQPASPRLRGIAALLIAVCVPALLPWRLRALPRNHGTPPLSLAASAVRLPQYAVVDLGTLGGKFSDAYAVGEDGTVVGTANVFPLGVRGHAFLWDRDRRGRGAADSRMTDLCAGSVYRHSLAYAINASGQVAATAFNSPLKPSAFVWTPDSGGLRRYLGALPGFRYSRAAGINSSGTVVGTALRGDGAAGRAVPMRALVWHNGSVRDLGTLGGAYSAAMAVSDSGAVVGKSDVSPVSLRGGGTHATLWKPGAARGLDLGTLPGGANSAASAVNRLGEVVGYSETADAARRAFCYSGVALEDLGTLPSVDPERVSTSTALGINDAGWIVGASSLVPRRPAATLTRRIPLSVSPPSRAVVWVPTQGASGGPRRLVDLNDCLSAGSGWTLETARAVNNRGEIVGVGQVRGRRHAFLLVPIAPKAALP